jgi:hypothetical protein
LANRLRAGQGNRPAIGALEYIIADPRVEFLRRAHRLVFDLRGIYGRVQQKITEDWYARLLARRFQEETNTTKVELLKANVIRLNTASLQVWRAMLGFARDEDLFDSMKVNARVAEWATAINSVCAREYFAPS